MIVAAMNWPRATRSANAECYIALIKFPASKLCAVAAASPRSRPATASARSQLTASGRPSASCGFQLPVRETPAAMESSPDRRHILVRTRGSKPTRSCPRGSDDQAPRGYATSGLRSDRGGRVVHVKGPIAIARPTPSVTIAEAQTCRAAGEP